MATATRPRQETVTNDGEILDAAIAATESLDFAMLRMETEQAFSEARLRPRKAADVIAELREELEAYPRIALGVIYAKPVGKDERGEMQFARGLSIRAAESIASAMRFNRVRCATTMLDNFRCQVEAVWVDFANGRFWSETGIVSRNYKKRGGGMAVHPEDRFHDVVVKAAKSKLIREAILRATPAAVKMALWDLADEVIDSMLDDKTVDKIVANFASKGVTLTRLEQHAQRPRQDWTKATRKQFIELWTAIEAEETTVKEAFGNDDPEKQQTPAAASTGAVTADALGSAQAAIEAKPNETPKQTPAQSPTQSTLLEVPLDEVIERINELRQELFSGDATAFPALIESVCGGKPPKGSWKKIDREPAEKLLGILEVEWTNRQQGNANPFS